MNLEDITPEFQEKAKACKTDDELIALAKSVGIELSENVLDGLSAGSSAEGELNRSGHAYSNPACPSYDSSEECRLLDLICKQLVCPNKS